MIIEHHDFMQSPIQGWMRHNQLFAFEKEYVSSGVRKFMGGTPAILSMKALEAVLEEELYNLLKTIPNTKIAVGFGISSIEQAQYVSHIADGVIIGSKLVSLLETSGIGAFEDKAKEFADIIHGGNL